MQNEECRIEVEMIDLNLKKTEKKAEDAVGIVILSLMPFAWLFWALIEWGLR